MKRKHLNLRIPRDLQERIFAAAAADDGISVNAKINELLWDSFLCQDCYAAKHEALEEKYQRG